MADLALWTLWNNSALGHTALRKVGQTGGVVTVGDEIVCPEPLTITGGGGTTFSTAVLRVIPYDHTIVYYAGRSDTTGNLVAYRYDDTTGTFTRLLDESPSTGTWPFATGMWAEHNEANGERVWLVGGNGSAWGAFANQNVDSGQGVWLSTGGAAFVTQGAGRHDDYAGSNINNPNSLIDIYVAESDLGSTPFVSHSWTKQFHLAPNSFPYWSMLSTGGGAWGDIPHSTGAQFEGGWTNLISPEEPALDCASVFIVLNGSGTGPYSLADSNFGSEYDLSAINPSGTTGLGPYHHNAACLVFRDDASILLSFHTDRDADLGTIIDTHSPRSAPLSATFNYIPGGNVPATACRLMESGGGAVALTAQAFGFGTILTSLDYGASWTATAVADSDGIAVDAGLPPEPPPNPQVELEVLSFRDSRNIAGVSRFYVSGDDDAELQANASALASLFEVLSNGHFTGATGPFTTSPVLEVRGNDDLYQNIEMRLRLVWLTADGLPIAVEIPCPTDTALLDDQESPSILNPGLSAAAAGGVTYKLSTRGGLLAVSFAGAGRVMRGFTRRFNVGTLEPSETGTGE